MNLRDFVLRQPGTQFSKALFAIAELAVTQFFINRQFDVETVFADVNAEGGQHCSAPYW